MTPRPLPARPTARRTRVAACLAGVAALLTAWSGHSWYAAAHDDSAAFARTRDQVLAAGEQAVQNLNTLDHADLGPGLDLWENSTTGALHDQLVQGRAAFTEQVRQARTVTSARILSGAVTELDDRAGRATVMVAVRITVQVAQEAPTSKDSRLLGELTRTGPGWKLSGLGQAPTGTTAATATTAAGSGTPSPSPSH